MGSDPRQLPAHNCCYSRPLWNHPVSTPIRCGVCCVDRAVGWLECVCHLLLPGCSRPHQAWTRLCEEGSPAP
ncbi:hypothetical protein JZ751_000070 [Albula glossodonta]|uniref:Uncharacterized protein n=1 Tax=Albula glossodonta TaxID=121402 RepID=A0A8T2PUS1_9TELE|nr:hypothetical protein JZ751_000070 [Albula glossodonta]